jgi:cation diffusion facilitator CzcD-associated flavoprotein CzcO
MPYLPFPENWPVFTPKDKLAEWMESYAQLMELNVWSSTKLLWAKWDGTQWEVKLERQSQSGETEARILRPHHIIQATGVSGEPSIPQIEGMNTFQGSRLCHSSQFSSAQSTSPSKQIVVVGSGVSAHDIAQDFYEHGHKVTMIQRSATCVDSSQYIHGQGLYSEDGPPTDEADLLTHSVPLALLKSREIEKTVRLEQENHEFFKGLRRAGFKVDKGPDGAG